MERPTIDSFITSIAYPITPSYVYDCSGAANIIIYDKNTASPSLVLVGTLLVEKKGAVYIKPATLTSISRYNSHCANKVSTSIVILIPS